MSKKLEELLKSLGLADDKIKSVIDLTKETNENNKNLFDPEGTQNKLLSELNRQSEELKNMKDMFVTLSKKGGMTEEEKNNYEKTIKSLNEQLKENDEKKSKQIEKEINDYKNNLNVYQKKYQTTAEKLKQELIRNNLFKIADELKIDKKGLFVDVISQKGYLDFAEEYGDDGTLKSISLRSKPISYKDKSGAEIKDKIFETNELKSYFETLLTNDEYVKSNFDVVINTNSGSGFKGVGSFAGNNQPLNDSDLVKAAIEKAKNNK